MISKSCFSFASLSLETKSLDPLLAMVPKLVTNSSLFIPIPVSEMVMVRLFLSSEIRISGSTRGILPLLVKD